MTETAPLSTQTAVDDEVEKRVSTVGRVHPHVEIKIVDPETGATVPRGTPGEQCTRGYSVMLGYWNDERGHARGDRRRRLDALRRPRDHGRRGLREDRRAHQGHAHPRRREHLPARGRGVPAHDPRGQRRLRHRRAERALRRGGHGVGQAARGQHADPRGADRRLPRADRHLQDPALLEARRRVPDDDHRQGAEVRHARDRRGGAGGASERIGADGRDRAAHTTGQLAAGVARLGTETAFSVLARARAMERAGRDVIHLEIGEPDFDTPAHITEAAHRRAARGRDALLPGGRASPSCARRPPPSSRARAACAIAPERVLVANGAKPFLFFTILATCEPGDEVVYPDPGFPIYESAIRWVGRDAGAAAAARGARLQLRARRARRRA